MSARAIPGERVVHIILKLECTDTDLLMMYPKFNSVISISGGVMRV